MSVGRFAHSTSPASESTLGKGVPRIPSFSELVRSHSAISFGAQQWDYADLPHRAHAPRQYPGPSQLLQGALAPILPPPVVPHPAQDSAVKTQLHRYLARTREVQQEVSKLECHVNESSIERLPEEQLNKLAEYHEMAARIIKTAKRCQTGYKKMMEPRSKSPIGKGRRAKKKRCEQSQTKDEHGQLSFTVKPIGVLTHSVQRLACSRDYLNKDLCLKRANTICSQCGSTQTPEWRSGPSGSRTLCNACGLFYSKLIKRMGVAVACDSFLKRKKSGNVFDRRISAYDLKVGNAT